MPADRTLLVLNEIRALLNVHSARFDALDARLDREFSEIHDRLRRIDERIYGGLNEKAEESNAALFTPSEITRIRRFFNMGS